MEYDEGVIKFDARHTTEELNARKYGPVVRDLIAWRAILVQTGLVGQDPGRYGGAGYGNVSGRGCAIPSPEGPDRSWFREPRQEDFLASVWMISPSLSAIELGPIKWTPVA